MRKRRSEIRLGVRLDSESEIELSVMKMKARSAWGSLAVRI